MVDVVSDQTEIDYAEAVTLWSGDSFTLETEILVQGSNSVAVIQTANGVNDVIVTIAAGSWDMSGQHIRMYINSNVSANMAVEASNGLQIWADDGTNRAYWTVGGKDTYAGGWRDFFVDVDSTPTSGTVNTAAITSVGFRINTITKPRNATNGWYDNFRFGNGVEINSTTTEAISFADVAVEDALVANKYDIMEDIDETIFTKGSLTLGNAAAAKNCNLVSLNESISFIDRVVSTTLYALVTTQGTGWTDVDIEGLSCKTNGLSGGELDFTDTRNLRIVGSSFLSMGTLLFANGGTSTEVNTTKFTSCGTTDVANGMTLTDMVWGLCKQITLNASGVLANPTINNCIDAVSVLGSSLNNITGGVFASDGSNHAIELDSIGGGSMTWDNSNTGYDAGVVASPVTATNTGNEDIYVNVVSGTLTINVATGASIPSIRSAGAIVNVVAGQVNVKVIVLDDATSLGIDLAHVRLVKSSDKSVIISGATNASGVVETNLTYSADIAVEGWARQWDISGDDYTPKDISGTITSSGLLITVRLSKI